MTAFGFMSLVGGRLSGKLVPKTGPRLILTLGLVFAFLADLLLFFAGQTPGVLIFSVGLLGVGFIFTHSTLLTRATQFADKARGAAMSLVAFCFMGGGGIGTALSGGKFMSDTNCNCAQKIMIITCSGGSNVGQLSNQVAVEMTREGFGKIFCLAGIGGQLSGFVQSAKGVENMVAIDGCTVGCAKAILEQADVPLKNHVIITDLGIEKNKNFALKAEDIAKVTSAVRETCSKHRDNDSMPLKKPFNCCG